MDKTNNSVADLGIIDGKVFFMKRTVFKGNNFRKSYFSMKRVGRHGKRLDGVFVQGVDGAEIYVDFRGNG